MNAPLIELAAVSRCYPNGDSEVRALPGLHDWGFAAEAFTDSLPWIASEVGTPGAPPPAPRAAKI